MEQFRPGWKGKDGGIGVLNHHDLKRLTCAHNHFINDKRINTGNENKGGTLQSVAFSRMIRAKGFNFLSRAYNKTGC